MTRPYIEKRYATDEEWRDARKGGVGGSDVAAIMGLNPYRSPLEVWLEKTGREEPPDLSGKQSVEWGNRLEPLIAEKFAEEHPELKVRRKNCTMVSVKRPWAFANIDRELVDSEGRRGVLEIKTVGIRRSGDWVFGPPEYYLAQVQHYLSVSGYVFAWVAVLIGGQEYREFFVERDEADIRAIDAAVDRFWNGFVLTGEIPQMTGSKSEAPALAAMFQDKTDDFVAAMDADFPELGRSAELGGEIKALQAEKREVDNTIKARIGNARGIETESTRATWVRGTEKRFDKERFDKDNPGMTDPYMTEKPKDMGLRLSPARD